MVYNENTTTLCMGDVSVYCADFSGSIRYPGVSIYFSKAFPSGMDLIVPANHLQRPFFVKHDSILRIESEHFCLVGRNQLCPIHTNAEMFDHQSDPEYQGPQHGLVLDLYDFDPKDVISEKAYETCSELIEF